MTEAARIAELFAPWGEVVVRRMFGGAGVYADGVCFAIASRGEVFVRTDDRSQPEFEAAGSSAFAVEMQGALRSMPYWRLPAEAFDDPQALRRWATLGLEAARRVAAAKTAKPARKSRPKAR